MLATPCREKIDKQDEIDMANLNLNANLANATMFHLFVLGLVLGWLGFALGPRGFADTNMLVSVMQNASIRGLDQHVGSLDRLLRGFREGILPLRKNKHPVTSADRKIWQIGANNWKLYLKAAWKELLES